MPSNDRHHRRSQRLAGYDYAQPGAYFVTMVTQDRLCLCGDVVVEQMCLNAAGKMIQAAWLEMPDRFPHTVLDRFVVMPNHVHGIVVIDGDRGDHRDRPYTVGTPGDETRRGEPCVRPVCTEYQHPTGTKPNSLGRIVQDFKTGTTNRYVQGVRNEEWPALAGRLWQRGYYDRVIRSGAEAERIRTYIELNPGRWAHDRLH